MKNKKAPDLKSVAASKTEASGRLFLDDYRGAPVGWTRVETVKQFSKELEKGIYVEVSLDYDLKDPHSQGVFAASAIVERYARGDRTMKKVTLHTANDNGRLEMQRMLRSHAPEIEVVVARLPQARAAFFNQPSSS